MFQPDVRERSLQMAEEGIDILVIGGGITGCGIALDSALRGRRTLLIEKGDIASGTSSRSSKLIHGGLRYLKQMRIHLTRTACRERDRMIEVVPGLVRRVSCLYPAYAGDRTPGWVVGFGLGVYDLLNRRAERHRRVAPEELDDLAPGLEKKKLRRAMLYSDGLADDARLCLAVAASAAGVGAGVLTRVRAEEALRNPDGRIRGLVAVDSESGRKISIPCGLIINATGVWVDEVRHRLGFSGGRLRPSRGSHLILPVGALPLKTAVTFSSPVDGRPVFFVPHPEGILLGTTDLFHEGGLDDPRPDGWERNYLLESATALFPRADLKSHVVGAFAGLRPIMDTGAKEPSEASRDEEIWYEEGILNVAGGKLTTFRAMAEETMDTVDTLLGPSPRPCSTADFALKGWEHPVNPGEQLSAGVRDGMTRRLGAGARRAVEESRTVELAPLPGEPSLCLAEIRAHLRRGAVRHLDDLFIRRLRTGMWQPDRVAQILVLAESVIRHEMTWNLTRWRKEEELLEEALQSWRDLG